MLLGIIGYLGQPESKYIVVPLITIILGLVLKRTCQSDKYLYSYREYFYWAPNLLSSSLLVIFLDYCNKNLEDKTEVYMDNLMSAFILWVITLLLVVSIIRKWGWRQSFTGKIIPTYIGGIFIPNIICIILLFAVLNLMS